MLRPGLGSRAGKIYRTPLEKKERNRGIPLLFQKGDYFSASKTRSRIVSMAPIPETVRYCGTPFSPLLARSL